MSTGKDRRRDARDTTRARRVSRPAVSGGADSSNAAAQESRRAEIEAGRRAEIGQRGPDARGTHGQDAQPTARATALAALADRAGNVTARLNRLLEQSPLAPADAGLARELALGVVRRQRTLDAVIAAFQERADRPLPARLRSILRLGVYQLLFLQRVPDFAAVNEAVKQVGPKAAHLRGFVNALLRNIARAAGTPETGAPPVEPRVAPLGPTSFRRFDRPIFPDGRGDPAGYLAAAYSLPDELARKWLADFGSLASAVAVAVHADARAPLILRVNSLRATVEQVLAELGSAGIPAVAHANGLSIVLAEHVDLAGLRAFSAGLVQPQDASASGVVAACPVAPGMRVLDLCAAPGTKTTQLAERMANRGRIIAADVSGEKLARLEANCRRLGVEIVQTVPAEKLAAVAQPPFDFALVDAPCSNTGVLARRPEARWRFSTANLKALSADQEGLLMLATQLIRPGGACMYSTCSLEKQENQQVVGRVLARRRDLELLSQREIRPAGADDPANWSDGGYYALLRRR